jgi:hypothetical protein
VFWSLKKKMRVMVLFLYNEAASWSFGLVTDLESITSPSDISCRVMAHRKGLHIFDGVPRGPKYLCPISLLMI